MIYEALEKIVAEEDLTRVEAEAVMEELLCGLASDVKIAAPAHGAADEGRDG